MPPIKTSKPTAQITFYNYFEAPLDSGDYSVSITQTAASTASGNPSSQSYTALLTFAVLGPRFTLPPTYIHTLFPPKDTQGEFSNVLAHAVFKSKTLPWQREVQKGVENNSSWLAILTFDLNDPLPSVVTGTIQDLQTPPEGTVSYPDLELEYGESATDPCQYIDVPVPLFVNICPTYTDLGWLSHGREISGVADKPGGGSGGQLPPSDFSVVVSNRLPTPGDQTLCCLVSLETMYDYLPASLGVTPASLSSAQNVRLAVLAAWSFGAIDLPETFAEYFANLNDRYQDVSTPQIPYLNAQGQANPTVENALAMSYTALNHHTRQGADTVSWYRGPFLPYGNPLDVTIPATASDAIVHYDPDTGMFDESLAAAWQLGQLLALNDQNFATTLYTWKRGQTQAAIIQAELDFLASELGMESSLLTAGGRRPGAGIIGQVIQPMLQKFLDGGKK